MILYFIRFFPRLLKLFDPVGNTPDQLPDQLIPNGNNNQVSTSDNAGTLNEQITADMVLNEIENKNESDEQRQPDSLDADDVVIGNNSRDESIILNEDGGRTSSRVSSGSSSEGSYQSQNKFSAKTILHDDNEDVVVPERIKSRLDKERSEHRSNSKLSEQRTGSATSLRLGSGNINKRTEPNSNEKENSNSSRSQISSSAKDRN